MLEKVANGIAAASILVVGLAMIAIAIGVDTSLVTNFVGLVVEFIVSIGIVGIFCAVIYGIAEEFVG